MRTLFAALLILPITLFAQLKGQFKEVSEFKIGSVFRADNAFLVFQAQKTFREKRIVMPGRLIYAHNMTEQSPEINVQFGFGYALKPNVDLILYPFWYNGRPNEEKEYTPTTLLINYRLPHYEGASFEFGIMSRAKIIQPIIRMTITLIKEKK